MFSNHAPHSPVSEIFCGFSFRLLFVVSFLPNLGARLNFLFVTQPVSYVDHFLIDEGSFFFLFCFLDQVLSLLPPYNGKTVLELGAGIGRFTGELAKEAGHLLAVDFIESVIKKVFVDLYVCEAPDFRS